MMTIKSQARHTLPIVVVGVFAMALILFPTIVFAARTITSITVNGNTSATVAPGASINAKVYVTTTSGSSWKSTRYQIEGESSVCLNTTDYTTNGAYNEPFSITAPSSEGTYNLEVRVYQDNGCSGSYGSQTLNNAIIIKHLTITNVTVNNQPSVTVLPSSSVSLKTFVTAVGSSNSNDWKSTRYRIGSESWVCVNTPDHISDGSNSEPFNITTPSSVGTYNVDVRVYNNDSCSSGESDTYTLNNAITIERPPATIVASKVVCDTESALPNWGGKSGDQTIDANTAINYRPDHCNVVPWNFQWAYSNKDNPGDEVANGGSGWNTFSSTATIDLSHANSDTIKVREVFNDAYVPFAGNTTTDNVSAEMYCYNDNYYYDNYDFVNNPQAGHTYYCVAFNALVTGTVTIHKDVQGGSAHPADWTFTIDGKDYHDGDQVTLPIGSYTVQESGPSGYVLSDTSGVCNTGNNTKESSIATDDVSTIYMNVTSEGGTCTITNAHIPTLPNLTISKTDNLTTATPGQVLPYSITITNSGETAATNVQVTDTIPTYITSVTDISNSGSPSTGVITWNNLTVPALGSLILTYNATVDPGLSVGTYLLHNVANLGCSSPIRPGVLTNPIPTCLFTGTATDDTSVIKAAPSTPLLTITKSVDKPQTNPGTTLNYTLTVKNVGLAAASNVTLTDTLPTGLTFLDSAGNVTTNTTMTWSFVSLAAGASQTVTYKVNVAASVTAQSYINTATVKADNVSPAVSAQATTTVIVPKVLGVETTTTTLAITKSASKAFANAGDKIRYTVKVTNTGDLPAIKVVLVDILPTGMIFSDNGLATLTWVLGDIAVGQSITKTYDVKLDAALLAGKYFNNASAKADNSNSVATKIGLEVKEVQVLGAEDEVKVLGAELPDTSGADLLGLLGGALLIGTGFLIRRK
jgi:uncharacterized repeat protein (TIGR01451 family)